MQLTGGDKATQGPVTHDAIYRNVGQNATQEGRVTCDTKSYRTLERVKCVI